MDPTLQFAQVHQVKKHRYIADGVYAGFMAGGELVLWTPREEGVHWLVLEPFAFRHLASYFNTTQSEPPRPAE